jgi:membrane protease YdiL (CAAX protease family)
MVALSMVSGAFGELPVLARLAVATWIGVGGVAAVVYRLTGAFPTLGDVRPANAGWAALAGAGLAVAGSGALSLEYALLPGLRPMFDQKERFFEQILYVDQPAMIPAVLFVVAVGPAVCEELLFRGVLRRYLSAHLGILARTLVLGLLFSLLHLDVTVLVPMTFIGAMLGVVAERARGWGAAAVAHFALNGFNALVWARVASDAEPGLLPSLVMIGIGTTLAAWAIQRVGPGFADAPEG